jgi:hypothetical protein
MCWAFGGDYGIRRISELDLRWRELHPDLPPILPSTSIIDSFELVAEQWLKRAG